jgi:hypothetical protein
MPTIFSAGQRLRLEDRGGVSGMSFGFGLKVSHFYLGFGMAQYHLAGMSNHLTVSTNPYDFFRKKTVAD